MAELARGTVTDRPWGRTLAALGLRGVSGQLTVIADGKPYRIVLAQGAVVAASSPLVSDAAVRVALTGHLVSSTQVAEIARKQAAAPMRDEIDVIAEHARLTPEQALRLRRRVIAQRAARTFSIAKGDFVVRDEIELATIAGTELDIRTVIFLGAKTMISEGRLNGDLASYGGWFQIRAEALEDLPQYGFGADEHEIVEALKRGAGISEMEKPGADQRLVRAVTYALVSCNEAIAEPARAKTPSNPIRTKESSGPIRTTAPSTSPRSVTPASSPRIQAYAPDEAGVPRTMTGSAFTPPTGSAPSIAMPGSNPGIATPGSHPGIVTPGSNPGIATPGSNPGIATPGSHPGIATSGSHPGIATPGSNPGIATSDTPRSARPGSNPGFARPGSNPGIDTTPSTPPPVSRTQTPPMGRTPTTGRAQTQPPASGRAQTQPPASHAPTTGRAQTQPTTGRAQTQPPVIEGLPKRPGTPTVPLPLTDSAPVATPTAGPATAGAPMRSKPTSAPPRAVRPTAKPPGNAIASARSVDSKSTQDVQQLIEQRLTILNSKGDHFALLGLPRDATMAQIRDAYFHLARQLHPDRLSALGIPDEQRRAQRLFAEVNAAFAVLSDPVRREKYFDILSRGGEAAIKAEQQKAEEMAMRILESEEAFRRGEMALRRDSLATAIRELERAIQLNPDEPDYHATLAWAKFASAPDKMAVATATRASLEQAIRKSPKAVTARFFLGRVERMLGKDQKALELFQEVLRMSPGHNEATAEVRVLEARLGSDNKGGLFGRIKR